MKNFITISDSVGVTVNNLLKSAIVQFNDINYKITNYSFIDTAEKVDNILNDFKDEDIFILFTVVIDDVKQRIINKCEKYNIDYYDALSPFIQTMSNTLSQEPSNEPSIYNNKLDHVYFKRIESIEFAVKYDDGKDPRGVHKADIVLLGISRTSKTPLSMYLAGLSYKVCNIPIVPGVDVPEEIYEADKSKIFGLTNNPEVLMDIRRNRLKSMGLDSDTDYSDFNRILEEINFSKKLYTKLGCPIINVSKTSIEETASNILKLLKSNTQ